MSLFSYRNPEQQDYFQQFYEPVQQQGIGPSHNPQLSQMPAMTPMPSHSTITPERSKLADLISGGVKGVVGGTVDMAQLAGKITNPGSYFAKSLGYNLPTMGEPIGSYNQSIQTEVDNWRKPRSVTENVGSFAGDILAPGPGELFTGAKLLGKGLMGLGPSIASLDDVARRMGKPPGSFTSELKNESNRYGNNYRLVIGDKTRDRYGSPGEPAVAGYIRLSADDVEGHLPVDMTYSSYDYRDKGFGAEMYKEALEKVKGLGYKGLASDPGLRNEFSEQIWDRPGITRVSTPDSGVEYDLMSEYISRGRDWQSSPIRNLFGLDKTTQPMLPGLKDFLIEQMKNRSSSTPIQPPPMNPPRITDWNAHYDKIFNSSEPPDPTQLSLDWFGNGY